ncbi:C4-dicarboxylate ABC transporter substrate-binding protein [Burkholderia sp. Leaf177]|uniref:TAXI family TRAP transporter solute-binding subunit n=1 Tax=Burkholderia sp. Leaf177 TaxID=1736287 RepID=UPI0006FEFD4E|nr:TAXI family TRAP transporter solute-binding subunit [Burkholderia sp. Leaf177]KQR74252.1 C4-dicarboxylate ABC transporter substrate-binding protein [Burkholderia sp. Leaf177]
MRKTVLMLFALLGLAGLSGHAQAQADYKIVTGPERGTYIQIGQDLAKWVADPINMSLDVLASKGSAENVQRMRYEPGVKFALVQSDVYQAYLDMAKTGNSEAGKIIQPLRLIMPLYNEEIYFVVRSDSPINYIHEIKDKSISVGLIGSGTAQSATTLYKLMFNQAIPEAQTQHYSNEDALAKLIVRKLDVAIIVAGQPAKLFQDLNPDLLSQIKLLKLDPSVPETARAEQTYFPATIRTTSYPNWIKEDSPTLTVKAFLVTYDYNLRGTVGMMTQFADSLCTHFDELQANGHPKWKQVKLELPPLSRGWKYYPPIEKRLRACIKRTASAGSAAPATPSAPKRACTDAEKVLMLCNE